MEGVATCGNVDGLDSHAVVLEGHGGEARGR